MDTDSMVSEVSKSRTVRRGQGDKHGLSRLTELAVGYGMTPEEFIDMVLDEYESYPQRWQRCRDACIHAGLYSGALQDEASLLMKEDT